VAIESTSPTPARSFNLADWIGRAEAGLRHHPVIWAIGAAIALFAIFVLLFEPAFDKDDDVVMMFIADGTSYAESIPHLVFINVAIGLVVSTLYGLIPSLPWYALSLYFLHLAALTTIFYLVFSHPRLRLIFHVTAVTAVLTLFTLYTWMNLQFTSVSMMLGAAGVFLYILRAHRPETPAPTIIIAGLMLGGSSLIRWTGWAGVIGLALPLFVLTVTRIPWRRQFLFAGTMILVVFGATAFQALYYAGNESWQDYNEFNDVRGDLHVTARLNEAGTNTALLEEIGWSRNDFEMFSTWFYLDDGVFTTPALEAILANTEVTTSGKTDQWIDPLFEPRWPQARWLLLAALFVPAVVMGSLRERLMVVSVVAVSALISVFSILYIRFPDRVAVSVLAFVALALLLIPGSQDPPRPRSQVTVRVEAVSLLVLIAVSLLVTVNAVRWVLPWSSENRTQQHALIDDFARLETLNPDGIFVTWTNVLQTDRVGPLSNGIEANIDIVPLGWQARAPFHDQHIRNLGIADIHSDIAAEDDIYLVSTYNQAHDRTYAQYMVEHYGFSGLMRPVSRSGSAGRVAVFDQMVDFTIDDDTGAVVAVTADGEQRVFSVASESLAGSIDAIPTRRDGTVTGWAADIAGHRAADLIVVIGDGRLVSLEIPFKQDRQLANTLGVDPNGRWAFVAKTVGDPADEYRVFALFDDRAYELTRQAE